MGTKFVIRGYHWGYNDETYYPCGSYINSVFNDEKTAKKQLIQLERDLWSQLDLGETDAFFNGPEGLAEKANAFIQEKLGKTLFDDTDDCRDSFIPKELDDDSFLAFLKLIELQGHKLTRFKDESHFYAIWFPRDEAYLLAYDEACESLIYGDSIKDLKSECSEELGYHWDDGLTLKGSLEALSESPNLLGALVEKCKRIQFNPNKNELAVSTEEIEIDDLFSLNELLKDKLFEVKTLGIEEVQSLEENMREYY